VSNRVIIDNLEYVPITEHPVGKNLLKAIAAYWYGDNHEALDDPNRLNRLRVIVTGDTDDEGTPLYEFVANLLNRANGTD
jgi:hypothetical protein